MSAPEWVVVPFPLRADFVASVVIPRGLTRREADRLAAMIRTLAVPDVVPLGRTPG